jgi:hypothetical protein
MRSIKTLEAELAQVKAELAKRDARVKKLNQEARIMRHRIANWRSLVPWGYRVIDNS